MKHLKNIDELIKESNWVDIALNNLKYDRDEEILEFFQELVDLGGKMMGIKNQTHTILDGEFDMKKRIEYTNKPLYQVYTFRLRFDELVALIANSETDKKMSLISSFFNEVSDAISHLVGYGYIFKLNGFDFDINMFNLNDNKYNKSSVMFDIQMYHKDDIVPWEYIFASPEFT